MQRWMRMTAFALALVTSLVTSRAASAQRKQQEADPAKAAKSVGGELSSEQRSMSEGMGVVNDKFIRNTLTLDLAGVAFGDGINGQYVRSNTPKFSTILGANYSRTDGVGGAITKFGAEVGVDYFLIGQHNEGLRVGPRVVGSIGIDTTGSSAGFADVGAGAELGYNFISRTGISAGAAAGWDLLFKGRLGGSSEGDIDGHPYGKLNVGYSW